jgi:hypothetical protein
MRRSLCRDSSLADSSQGCSANYDDDDDCDDDVDNGDDDDDDDYDEKEMAYD